MKRITTLFIFFITVTSVVLSQEELPSIYNQEKPRIQNIWHRVGDYSSALRSVESAEISADSRLIVSGAKFGYSVMLWQTADGSLLWEKEHESEVECVTFSPDALKIATGGEDFYLRIWNTEDGAEIKKMEHPNGIDGLAWSNNGEMIATGTEGGDLFLWNAKNYKFIDKINLGSSINSIQFTRDDKKIVAGGNIKYNDENGNRIEIGFAKLLQVDNLKVLIEFEGFDNSVKSVRISNDGKYLATGSVDRRAKLFNPETGELIHTFYEPKNIEAVAFTSDSRFLVTGGHEDAIRFYRMGDFRKVYEMESVRTEYIDFSDDGRLMVTGHEDSGLLSLYMMISDTHRIPGLYRKVSHQQLKNRDLQNKK